MKDIQLIGKINDRVEEIVRRSGKTYAVFADECKVSRPCLSQIINKKRFADINTLIKISKVTGYSIDWMVGISEERYRL